MFAGQWHDTTLFKLFQKILQWHPLYIYAVDDHYKWVSRVKLFISKYPVLYIFVQLYLKVNN